MKKNLKTTLLAMALLASVSGVFATDVVKAIKGQKTADYSWQKYNRDGSEDGLPQMGDENNPFPEDCNSDKEVCAIGTPTDPLLDEIVVQYN